VRQRFSRVPRPAPGPPILRERERERERRIKESKYLK
jgi:hypothetical protein